MNTFLTEIAGPLAAFLTAAASLMIWYVHSRNHK